MRWLATATVLMAVTMITGSASAHDDVPTEPCHLLCVTANGRMEASARPDAPQPTRFWFQLTTQALLPRGGYTSTRYQTMPAGSRAFAMQWVPSITWRATDDLIVFGSFPFEYNYSDHVVLPTLLEADDSHTELAPGRISLSVQARVPVPSEWGTSFWAGVGYGLSNPIGTVDVSPTLSEFPTTGIEGLGIGTDDLYATFQLIPHTGSDWEAALGTEVRLHSLPRWQRLYGTTVSYNLWLGHRVGRVWTVGASLSGYHTMLQQQMLAQTSLLQLRPTVARTFGDRVRVAAGLSSELPGLAVNANVLQTLGAQVTVGVGF